MWNAWLDESQAGIKIAWRNINNLRYVADTTLMAESEEELKSLLMKVKEQSEKSWLKTQHSKNKDHGIWNHGKYLGKQWLTSKRGFCTARLKTVRKADEENEEELQSLLMKVQQESEKAGLKLNIKKY